MSMHVPLVAVTNSHDCFAMYGIFVIATENGVARGQDSLSRVICALVVRTRGAFGIVSRLICALAVSGWTRPLHCNVLHLQ